MSLLSSTLHNLHPSIHPFIVCHCLSSARLQGRAAAYPSKHWARGWVHPGQVASSAPLYNNVYHKFAATHYNASNKSERMYAVLNKQHFL